MSQSVVVYTGTTFRSLSDALSANVEFGGREEREIERERER